MRSAWLKWARAVEHQRVLARRMREFNAISTYEYGRTDNAGDGSDPVLRVHWTLKIKQEYPESWSVLIGDALTNLRAALDHAFWAAAVAHSGSPARPTALEFPIIGDVGKFAQKAATLAPLVPADVWTLIEKCQPYHAGTTKHTVPVEILRWLSNVDKHRFVHVVGRTAFDVGPVIVQSVQPLDVLDEWRNEGPVSDGQVVARLKLRRPAHPGSAEIVLTPVFAHTATVQISDSPAEYRTLASAMDIMQNTVLEFLTAITAMMQWDMPDVTTFELGEEHEAVAPEHGGNTAHLHAADGSVHRLPLPPAGSGNP